MTPREGTRHGLSIRTIVALVCFGLLAGCGSIDRDLQSRIAQEALSLSPPVDDDETVLGLGREAAQGGGTRPGEVEVAPEAGLEEIVAITLERNPAIRRAVRNLQVLGYRVPQVTSLEDPMIMLIPPTGSMVETAAGMMDAELGISQVFPFPGKLTRRGRVAEHEVRMALAALSDIRVRTAARVAKAYYDYYLADVSQQITTDSEHLLEQIRAVASARYRAGTATQQDVLRAEVELYELMNERMTIEQQIATARARLNSLMNRRIDAPLPPPKQFDLEAVGWRLPEAMDRAVAASPRLASLREQVARDLESIRLARLEYFPDLRLGFNYAFIGSGISPVASGEDNWNLPLGLNLPIWWRRLRAGVLESNARALASVEELEAMRNTIFFGLQDTLVKIDTEYRRAVLFRDLLVPRSRQVVQVSASAYQAGTLEFTALIDNWRKWLDLSLGYHRALARLEQRFADLQQLIGIRVTRSQELMPVGHGPADAPDGSAGKEALSSP